MFQLCSKIGQEIDSGHLKTTLSEQIAHSTVDLHLKEISEFLHGSAMNKRYTQVSRSLYTHKIQSLRIRPIEPIASESAA